MNLPWLTHVFEFTPSVQFSKYLPSSAFDHSRSGLDHPPFPLVALEYRIFKTRFGHSHSHKVEAIKLWTIFSHMQCSCHIFCNVIQTFLESGFFDLISLSLASILGLVTQKVKWGECEVVLFCGKFYGRLPVELLCIILPVELVRLLDPVDAHQPMLAGVGLLQVGQVEVLGLRHIFGCFQVDTLQLFHEVMFGKHLVADHRIPGPVIACRAAVVHLQLAESEFKVE